MEKLQKKRMDVFEDKEADNFARENTHYLIDNNLKCGYVMLKSLSDNNQCYLAKLKKQKSLLSDKEKITVDKIYLKPFSAENIDMREPTYCFGVDVSDLDGDHFFSSELYDFKTLDDRKYFEYFCLEVGTAYDWRTTLDKLAPYFSDRNFVLMAKDKAFELAFKIGGSELGLIDKNLLERKIKKEIDKRVTKFAAPEREIGEKEF